MILICKRKKLVSLINNYLIFVTADETLETRKGRHTGNDSEAFANGSTSTAEHRCCY